MGGSMQGAKIPFGILEAENTADGHLIKRISNIGCAAAAGVLVGDTIISFDGKKASCLEEYEKLCEPHAPGATVPVLISREGRRMALTVKLEEQVELDLQMDEVMEVLERKISP
jgi:S1-C subfamily serine protease